LAGYVDKPEIELLAAEMLVDPLNTSCFTNWSSPTQAS
jgi:hypothetical protein